MMKKEVVVEGATTMTEPRGVSGDETVARRDEGELNSFASGHGHATDDEVVGQRRRQRRRTTYRVAVRDKGLLVLVLGRGRSHGSIAGPFAGPFAGSGLWLWLFAGPAGLMRTVG